MAVAYSTLLNGGTRYEPEVAAGVVTSTGHVVERYEPRVVGHVALNSSITSPIIEGLLGVVNDPTGTAYGAFQQYAHYDQASFVVGGKTGTASNQSGLEPNSWFIGFGPNPNPQLRGRLRHRPGRLRRQRGCAGGRPGVQLPGQQPCAAGGLPDGVEPADDHASGRQPAGRLRPPDDDHHHHDARRAERDSRQGWSMAP